LTSFTQHVLEILSLFYASKFYFLLLLSSILLYEMSHFAFHLLIFRLLLIFYYINMNTHENLLHGYKGFYCLFVCVLLGKSLRTGIYAGAYCSLYLAVKANAKLNSKVAEPFLVPIENSSLILPHEHLVLLDFFFIYMYFFVDF
jgi:hypothetical protein